MLTGQTSGTLVIIIYIFIFIAIYYFLLVLPQRRRAQERGNIISNLKVNDNVVTIAGIYGKVKSIEEDTVMLEIADGVVIKVAKDAVAGIIIPGAENPPS
ncbi:MAG TPA: preprotein translocase subunit YajC [Candidatus Aquicultor sp.]|jgi:preprotein translocase subunit YajC